MQICSFSPRASLRIVGGLGIGLVTFGSGTAKGQPQHLPQGVQRNGSAALPFPFWLFIR